ncbi:respiratory nitrate reductase subunit gamma, partial [Burkholderia pseudomallei]
MDYLNTFVYGIYPYIAAAIVLFGSLARFEREEYTWKSESSQVLHRGARRTGTIL